MKDLYAELVFCIAKSFFGNGWVHRGPSCVLVPVQKGVAREHHFISDYQSTTRLLAKLHIVRPVTRTGKKKRNRYKYYEGSSTFQLLMDLEDIRKYILQQEIIDCTINELFETFINMTDDNTKFSKSTEPFIPPDEWKDSLKVLAKYGYIKIFWQYNDTNNFSEEELPGYTEYFQYTDKILELK